MEDKDYTRDELESAVDLLLEYRDDTAMFGGYPPIASLTIPGYVIVASVIDGTPEPD